MTLTQLTRAIRNLMDAEDRMAAARRLLPSMEDTLTERVTDETAAAMWLQLAREATGEPVLLLEDPADREAARAACLAALAPPKRGRGQPRRVARRIVIGFEPDVLTDLERAVAEGRAATIAAEVNRRCRAFFQSEEK